MGKRDTCLRLAGMLLLLVLGTGCGGPVEAAEVKVEPLDMDEDVLLTEAEVQPARWSELRFEVGGTVVERLVEPGDAVAAGEVLLQLDPTDAGLAVEGAHLAVEAARASLAQLRAGPRAEVVAAEEAELDAAQAVLAQAVAQRDLLTGGALEAEMAAAEAAFQAAQAEQLMARDARDEVYRHEKGYEEEKEEADYRLHAAREALEAARVKLEMLQRVVRDRTREAEAGVWVASADRDVAQAELDLVQAGSAPWEVAAAEAAVQQAEAALAAAEVALTWVTIRAPFDGVVTRVEVEVGDTVVPAQTLAVLAAPRPLELRTIDLTELDVIHVKEGQQVAVTVDALPDRTFAGAVREIALRAGEYRGDVVYAVTVDLDDVGDTPLLWGMTALVEIEQQRTQ